MQYRQPMPVELEFQPDPQEASAASATDSPGLFGETLLVVPVRFRVDGHDLLPIRPRSTTTWSVDPSGTASPNEPILLEHWTQQPLLGFMCGLRQAIEAAERSGQSRCYLIDDRDLVLTLRDGSQLEVMSPSGTASAVAPIREFRDAVAHFEQSVHHWLTEQAPHLMRHPSWAEWFPTPEP
jgi:hypothetical protein